MAVKHALISVSNKDGIIDFSRGLQELDVDLISTGGTYKVLTDAGIKVRLVSDLTKYPEMLGGRVKTLHPVIHGGILAERDNKEHMKELHDHDIMPIDLVVANLYQFESVTRNNPNDMQAAIENIDIGGPALIRSAAKNYEYVTVIVDPKQYPVILNELKKNGSISNETRTKFAFEAFQHTAEYDTMISEYFKNKFNASITFPEILNLKFKKVRELKYGANPHEKGALYRTLLSDTLDYEQLHGSELTYNKILGLNCGLDIVKNFDMPAVAIIKHTNPCGVAVADSINEAYMKALDSDSLSAFGGLICSNRVIDTATAGLISQRFFDAIIAPDFDEKPLEILKKKRIIIVRAGKLSKPKDKLYFSKISDGLLAGEQKNVDIRTSMKTVSKIQPTPEQIEELMFAWKVVQHLTSNAVVITQGKQTLGIGAGQTSRIDAIRIALGKAGNRAKSAVLASDGFFPFRDSVDASAKHGISAIIQPGGSVRDNEDIDAADENKIPMVFTGIRAFKH